MATNDNTLKTIGFIYQTYIGLIKCLEMKENDKVIIENLGDVTLISAKGNSVQIEVKHHLEPIGISDRSDEIWNTVWNWYNNFNEYKKVDEFILFTTGSLSSTSVFQDWEIKNISQKYNTFKSIGIEIRDKEDGFRKSYDKIFNNEHEINKLKSVLNRFKILSKQQTIKTIVCKYESTTFKFLAEKSKMEQFVSFLIGILLTIPIKSECWAISYEEFDAIFKEYSKRFAVESNMPIPTEFENYEVTHGESDNIKCKRFVEEINIINLKDEVADAINDYCRTYKTIIGYFDSNIVKVKDLRDYKVDLTKILNSKRKSYKLKCQNDDNLLLLKSQEMYFDSIALDAKNFNGVSNNRSFFQNGVMHIIVDEGDLTWYVGEKK
ncbi:hypothetical protein [Clostridium estertheticum]|uniref:Uncharacterized protein n=1 Tax=Clostridium estertheticum subsp. estertheticum TaxID=1552 RepID=A0A1J0GF59_9CLOT|nr:hypothetical protein [Clostridium estertheticum]APC39965.1 hypothetical protein A7L45_07730 [Clostridium estertheticum subsp. estertheticum]MBZ9613961.1 hypothetical protein [Clostridium estertheticum subsp. laramiense]WAG73919.1 hypothetical protein LL032_00195 [Clostridium estertheticum]